MKNILSPQGALNSVYPCTGYLTFGPWIYLVPQYKPESILMLGYAGGTTAGLIKLFYGDDVKITGVDINIVDDPYNSNLIKMDAFEYLKNTNNFYDTIIVDIWNEKNEEPCDFVTLKEFVDVVEKKCNYLIIHASEKTNMSNYSQKKLLKTLALNNSRFYYFIINRVASLPIR